MSRRFTGILGVVVASLMLTWTAAAGDGQRSRTRTNEIETVDHKDVSAGTITLAGTVYRVDEDSKMVGSLGERIRVRELVANRDGTGEAHKVRFSAERRGHHWRISALEVLGFDQEE